MSRIGSIRSTQKIVLSLLIVCFLVLGLLVAVLLVRQQQDIRSGAAGNSSKTSVLSVNGPINDPTHGVMIAGTVVTLDSKTVTVKDSKNKEYKINFDQQYPGALYLETSTELPPTQNWIYMSSDALNRKIASGQRVVVYLAIDGNENSKLSKALSESAPTLDVVEKLLVIK